MDRKGGFFSSILLACALSAAGLTLPRAHAAGAANDYVQEIREWQQKRFERLKANDGWPTLAGLFWLTEGPNHVGSEDSFEVVLPAGTPSSVGILFLEKGKVRLQPEKGVALTIDGKPVEGTVDMVSDQDPKHDPTLVRYRGVSFFVIQRGERLGVRVRDQNSPARKQLSTLEYYPVDPQWKLNATFEKSNPPKKITIVNILGMVEQVDCPGALVFRIHGKDYRLDVLEEDGENEGEKVFFVIFADPTNGKETYGSGRYLYTSTPDSKGMVTLDFNKAFSPPCAFTKYATCPLPPKQNRLPVAISAGEKYQDSARH